MNKRLVGTVLGVLIPVALILLQPFPGLDYQGTTVLSILIGAIVWWIAKVLPDYVTAMMMASMFVIVSGLPVTAAFSAFSSSTWWLLVGAFCLAAGMQRCGLLKRLSAAILGKFPRTFRAQATGLMAASFISGPLIPSITAKCAILTPFALSISDQMGYERKGRQANGLFTAVFTSVCNVAPAVMSASFIGYVVLGLLPAETQQQFDLAYWLLAALPWLVIVVVLNYLAIIAFFEPKEERQARRARRARKVGEASSSAREEADGTIVLEDLGPMTRAEKQMLAIMAVSVAMWIFESVHGVPAYAVALLAVVAMAFCGIFKKESIRDGVAWNTIVFMGIVLSLASVFSQSGVDEWIIGTCAPYLTLLAGNPYLVVIAIAVFTVLLRFIIVSETAFVNLFMVFAIPFAAQLGVNPWVIGFAVYAMVNPWITAYQNPIYLSAIGSVDGQMTSHGDLGGYSVINSAICLLGLIVSVPYWQFLGLVQ